MCDIFKNKFQTGPWQTLYNKAVICILNDTMCNLMTHSGNQWNDKV